MRGLFGTFADGVRGGQMKAADVSALTWAKLMGEETSSKAGVAVNIDTALKVSTVYACLRVRANGIAQVPLKLFRQLPDGGREVATNHPVHALISRRPNEWMTSFEFRQMAEFHAGLLGVFVAYIGRVRGEPRELIPLVPGTFTLKQAADWTITAELKDAIGGARVVERGELFILRGPMWQGPAGLSALELAREAIGLALATEETHAALHANGAQPGGILSIKGSLDDDAKARLKEAWAKYQTGLRNKFRTAVLDMDATWTAMAATGVDNQHLETRRFQIEEVCRDLGVFPQMVGYSDKTATFASAEAFFQAHVTHTLEPECVNWEQSLARDLFPTEPDLFAKFMLQGLLRGDNKTRAEFYKAGINDGWLTRNEARGLEELNPLAGLDEPLVPLNMGTQAERDAAIAEGDDNKVRRPPVETKVGRVLSAANERRIVSARDKLTEVLDTLPKPEGD